ncbi:MAG: transposase [Patescibacteria group bacterium]
MKNKRNFATNELYHIFDRGVDRRNIFVDKSDQIRFIHDLYEFNDKKPALQYVRRDGDVGRPTSNIERDKLVKIHAFALMPNHHHLIIEQLKDNGVILFMKKIHGGYARGFNEKHKRSGYLFQGRYQDVHIEDDKQLMHLVCYIHANPLSMWKENWKEKKLTKQEITEAMQFLEKYRWSSFLDYVGTENFPSVIDNKFLTDFFGGPEKYKKFFIDWLEQYQKNETYIQKLILD